MELCSCITYITYDIVAYPGRDYNNLWSFQTLRDIDSNTGFLPTPDDIISLEADKW